MGFAPIRLQDYARMHLKSNPGDTASEITERLKWALEKFKAGVVCDCGEPIWVIGASQVGLMCFTCITGSTDNSEDYEIDEACLKSGAPRRKISEEDLPL